MSFYAGSANQWENQTGTEDDCTCLEDRMYMCDDCGEAWNEPTVCHGYMRALEDHEQTELYPAAGCPHHWYDDRADHDNERYERRKEGAL